MIPKRKFDDGKKSEKRGEKDESDGEESTTVGTDRGTAAESVQSDRALINVN